ncbi:MAG TPA: hypothetical protein VF947_03580 [Myxococcales bacterium]
MHWEPGGAPEELLVHEAGQELWLGLYFSPELRERIETLGTSSKIKTKAKVSRS